MLDLGTLQAHIKLDGADKFKEDLDTSSSKADGLGAKLKGGLVKAGKVMGTAFVAAGAAATAAFGVITKGALSAYSDTEQLRGGVEKLFGDDAAKDVVKNADAAFATVGISANKYMENVTSFSASLISSMGGDTKAAAKVADMAMRDMADNANVFGTDMESITNAYQGFARGQYQLLDNLKLGYGGTKEEMERLLADAGKLTGQKYDISNLNDVYNAIHAIQEEQNIAGTTAKEATKTISGSINATKAAYQNFLAGLADPNANLTQLVDNLVDSAMNVADNVIPVISRITDSIGDVLPQLTDKIGQLLPKILPIISNLILQIGKAIPNLLRGVIGAITSSLPQFIDAGIELFNGLVKALPEVINELVAALPQIINAIVAAIPRLIPAIVQAGITLFTALVQNLPAIIAAIVAAVPQIISAFISGLNEGAGQIFKAGGSVMMSLVKGIAAAISTLGAPLSKMKALVASAVNSVRSRFTAMKNGISNAVGAVKNVVAGMVSSISSAFGKIPSLINRVIGFFKGLGGKIKSAVGNLGSLLVGAGQSIMSGLLSGINEKWEAIKTKVSGMGKWIKEHKGPKKYDLNLLVENGGWIMQGLMDGLDKSMPALRDRLGGIADTIQGTKFNATAALAYADGAGANGATMRTSEDTTYNVYINGAKINDDKQIEGKFKDLLTSMARKGMM